MSEALLRLSPSVHWREIEGEIVAVDTQGGEYLGINPSGAALWPVLARGTTPDELADRLVEAFGLDRDAAVADVERFLADLDRRHLLER